MIPPTLVGNPNRIGDNPHVAGAKNPEYPFLFALVAIASLVTAEIVSLGLGRMAVETSVERRLLG